MQTAACQLAPVLGERPTEQARQLDSRREGSSATVRMEQLAPENVAIRDPAGAGTSSWKDRILLSLVAFKKRTADVDPARPLPKRVRSYYRRQDELVAAFGDLINSRQDVQGDAPEAGNKVNKHSLVMAKASFTLNAVLLIAKATASAFSGSLSLISSVIDSSIDLVSGMLLWYTSRRMEQKIPHLYPTGQARLEPVAVMILATIMSVAAFQLIVESIRDIVHIHESGGKSTIVFDTFTVCILGATIVLKLILYYMCRRIPTPTAQALAQDHRNDVLSNGVAAAGGFIGQRYWSYADPVAAILISMYIFFNWWQTGSEQIRRLTGYTAQPELLSRLTFLCLTHDSRIQQIDTLRAYHFGNKFLVEVHIILSSDVTLTDSHDIGSALQKKLENVSEVERAFVHLEYASAMQRDHSDHQH